MNTNVVVQNKTFSPMTSETTLLEKPSRLYDVAAFEELGLLNSMGKPRLNRAIGHFCNNTSDFKLLEELFCYWRDYHEYIVLRRSNTNMRTMANEWEYVAVKASKRGNDVYVSRIKKRFHLLEKMTDNVVFFRAEDFKTNNVVHGKALWVTLTYDTKRCSRREAWENIGVEYNRFISAVRRRYGKVSVIRSWESYENGYPHIHAVLWFHDSEFSVFPSFNMDKGEFSYRIKEKHEFDDLWHSWVDVKALSSLRKVVSYVRKYQMKVSRGAEANGSKGVKTLSFMWLFRKRSYSVSGGWRQIFSDLISRLHNSNMLLQKNLDGNVIFEPKWEFEGVFSGQDLGINPYIWACRLNKEQIGVVLNAG